MTESTTSPSRKSASASTRPARNLKRATARNVRIRRLGDQDLQYLWAGYRMDLWNDLLLPDMSRQEFHNAVIDMISLADLDFMIEVQTSNGLRPVGIVLANFRFGGNGIEPHVDWFPWATPRNRLEGSLQFIREIGKQHKIFLYVSKDSLSFWEHVHQYKTLKKGCKIMDCYGPGDHAMMYYSPGPF